VLYAQVRQADGATTRNLELDKRQGRVLLREVGVIKNMTGLNLLSENLVANVITRQTTQNLQAPLQGHALWQQNEVEALLREVGLPEATPLSIFGVELLPEPNESFTTHSGRTSGR
jgi:hypothetical protein